MKTHPFLFAGLCALVVGAMPQPARALPFSKNCQSFISWMNARKWSTPTSFSGTPDRESGDDSYFVCSGIYITETSPMGTRVCKGEIFYRRSLQQGEWHAKDSNCRWR